MKNRVSWMVVGGIALLALLQLANPARINPPLVADRDVSASNGPPEKVAGLLRTACYDCHSYETQWPWYSKVAPVSWFVVPHVTDGRKHLNFSEWPHDNPRKARSRWQNVRDEVESGSMPLRSYTWLHPTARLSAADQEELIQWASQEAKRLSTLMEAEAAK